MKNSEKYINDIIMTNKIIKIIIDIIMKRKETYENYEN